MGGGFEFEFALEVVGIGAGAGSVVIGCVSVEAGMGGSIVGLGLMVGLGSVVCGSVGSSGIREGGSGKMET